MRRLMEGEEELWRLHFTGKENYYDKLNVTRDDTFPKEIFIPVYTIDRAECTLYMKLNRPSGDLG